MKKVCVIAGLTATGKSKAAIELAQKWNAEIISADSVAVYKGLDIGSAKASLEEQAMVPHHMIDVLDYTETYNVARFQEEGRALIKQIHNRGKNVIVVGGTGLYIKALLYDYKFQKEHLEDYIREEETEILYKELLEKDPALKETIHPNNRKRIIRALESFEQQQKTRADITENNKDKQIIPAEIFFLQGDREKIYESINKRVEIMFEMGLEKEVKDFFDQDVDMFKNTSFQSIGYREFEGYLNHEISKETLKELIKRNTRRFAKRQITWFRHQQPSTWIDIFNDDVVSTILSHMDITKKNN